MIERLAPGPAQVQWVPGMDSGASSNREGEHTITFGDGLRHDAHCAFFFAAHEAGHLALGHTGIRAERKLKGLIAISVVIVIAAAVLVGAIVLPVVGLLALAVGWFPASYLILRFLNVREELHADDFAQDQGFSIPKVHVDTHVRRPWKEVALPTHPPWDIRQRHAQRRLDRTN